MIRFIRCAGLLLATALAVVATQSAQAQIFEGKNLVEARLVADVTQVAPGSTFSVGLVLKQADGWHTYWQYAGDSGLPTTIDWSLPEGVVVSDIKWPVPMQLVEPGDLIVYAYKDCVVLLSEVTVPEGFGGASLNLSAVAKWLVCREICIPGKAEVALTLPVGDKTLPQHDAETRELMATFTSMLPDAGGEAPFRSTVSMDGGMSRLILENWEPEGDVIFAPLPESDQVIGHVARVAAESADQIVFEIPILSGPQRPVRGIVTQLLSNGERRGWTLSEDQPGPVSASHSPSAARDTIGGNSSIATEKSGEDAGHSLWQFLFYGFVGGMILNLMPCVLPVISLKVFGFMKQAGESRIRILKLGLVFCAGVFVWFLGLAAVIVVLRSAGGQVNWAFQFQSPIFLLLICGLLVVFALNLFGVYEIVLPGAASQGLSAVAHREGYAGAFLHGLLATILATPCTAPFLGTALGFAFTQPAPVVFAMFGAVAGGMAFPFFILSSNPGWMRYLPKPGRWMESLKQFMGFPLLATMVWLLWVLGNQGGLSLVTRALAWLVALGMACWLIGRFGSLSRRPPARLTAWVAATALAVGGWLVFLPHHAIIQQPAPLSEQNRSTAGIAWKLFSRDAIAKELAEGRAVFVDFTAEWCLTCKFNERTVIDTPEVREVVARHNIAMLKGDWTNADPAIGEFLAEHSRVGVPFYLIYSPARPTDPQALPELLTKPMLVTALENAVAGTLPVK